MTSSQSAVHRPRRALRRRVAGAIAALALVVGAATSASAATVGSWAAWSATAGTAGARTGSVAIADLPTLGATFTSTASAATRQTGATTWLSESTPIGAKYGSSRNQPYLNAGPRGTAASVTTYTFDHPTPATGWAFALGDIDADQVTISATAPDGSAVSGAALGFQGGFNYCAPELAVRPSCTGSATDITFWNPATRVLIGNAAAADTSGAAGWFEPTTPLATLTFEFGVRSGRPIYQTWFVSLERDVTGTITDAATAEGLAGVSVALVASDGSTVATTTTGPGGTYSFVGVQASAGYSVVVTPPEGRTTDTPSVPVDLSETDEVADAVIRDLEPVTVSGSVTDTDGEPVADATVSIGDPAIIETTDADGSFTFPDVAPGTYDAELTPPDGFEVVDEPEPFTIEADSEEPVTGQDFTVEAIVAPEPTGAIAGTVDDIDGDPVADATITVVGDETEVTATTDDDGTYLVEELPLGTYGLTLIPPDGFELDGPATQIIELTTAGETVTADPFAVSAVPPSEPTPPTDPNPAGDPVSDGPTGAWPEGELPDTGGEPATLPLFGGIAFVLVGAVLVLTTRRRTA